MSERSHDLRLVFVHSPFENAFFGEVRAALVDAVAANGIEVISTNAPDEHEVVDDDVFVLLPPHEWVALEGRTFIDDDAVVARTIGLSAEQPHQRHFADNAAIGARLAAVLDFSRRAVDAYHALGVEATHLPFGYVPAWDRTAARAEHDVDLPVLYLGNQRPRRLRLLADAADALADVGAELWISDNSEPNRATSPAFVTGDAKRSLLARTGLLVNVHQSDEPYFEWLRFADATHAGTPMLTEHCDDSAPFVPGRHFLEFSGSGLAAALRALPPQEALDEMAAAALDVVKRHTLDDTVGVLLDVAARVRAAGPPPERLPARTRTEPIGRERVDPVATAAWPTRGARLRRAASKLRGHGDVVIAPPGTSWRASVPRRPRAPLVTVVAVGRDEHGASTLEGLWPWEPWRLRHGQHLGRVLVVDRALADDAAAWCGAEPWAADHPHLALQLFCVVHGLHGAHLRTPLAKLEVPADPSHAVPEGVARRCREILADHGALEGR